MQGCFSVPVEEEGQAGMGWPEQACALEADTGPLEA